MAKKKSSKKSNMGLILSIVILVLGVAAFCMAFLTCVKYTAGDTAAEFTGFQTMFGHMEKGEITGIETHYLAFSFMALLTFAMPLVGAVLSLVENKIVRFVGAGLMIAGAVLLFLLPSFAVLASTDGLSVADATATAVATTALKEATAGLGIGAILGGVFAGLGGLVGLYNTVRK